MSQGVAKIKLSGRLGGYALIDAEDLERVSGYRWHHNKTGYAQATRPFPGPSLHRFVVNAQPGEVVCHLNGNPLDCRKANLLRATQVENQSQRHARRPGGTIGASRYGFRANHAFDDLGCFQTHEEALLVRDFVVRCRLGNVATYNFPVPPELAYDPSGWREPAPEDPAWHPIARLAHRSRAGAAAWMNRKAALHACSGQGQAVLLAGSEWGRHRGGTGLLQVANDRWNLIGAWARPRGKTKTLAALEDLLEAGWWASWRCDNRLVTVPLWGAPATAPPELPVALLEAISDRPAPSAATRHVLDPSAPVGAKERGPG